MSFVEDTAVAPEKLRDYIERFLAHHHEARHHRGRLRACVGRMPARAAGRQHEDRRGRRASSKRWPTTSPISCSNSAARSPASTATGWCAARSCRRCSGRRFTRRSARSSGRSIPTACSIPARSSTRRRSPSNLRYGAGYKTPHPATFFDYSDYGGMGGAVEMCSGLGACRKTLDGTMCPSYMATRDEAHSTRGRANVLRLAMAGRLGESGLGDEGVQRSARPVPRVPCLQGGVSGRRGRGALQERVPRRLLEAPRHAAARPDARAHPRAFALGQPVRAGLELGRAKRPGAMAQRAPPRHRSPPRAAGVGLDDVRDPL